jgi:hypothetical protein
VVARVHTGSDDVASIQLGDCVHMNAAYLSTVFEPTYERTLGRLTYRYRWTKLDVVP